MTLTLSNRVHRELGTAITSSTERGNPLFQPTTPYIGLEHIERDLGTINGHGKASEVRSTKSIFQKGDLLYGKLRPYLNKVWVAQFDGMCSTDILVFPITDAVDNQFLKYRFMAPDFVNYAHEHSNGVNLPRVNAKALSRFSFWLPSFREQKRIVAQIEKQFTRLDAGVTALRRVQANLKRYRASVLKAACEGRLVPTEAELARAEGRSYEPADKLFARILTDRRQKWSGRGTYKEPAAPDISNLPSLPKGWTWASLDKLSWSSSYGTSAKCSYENSGFPVLRIPNIGQGLIDLSDLKFAATTEELEFGEALSPGDLLIIRTNGSKSLIGRSAVVREQLDRATSFASYLIRFRLINTSPLFAWIGTIWDVSYLRAWIERRAATSAGQHNISMSVLATMPIPLPPVEEQKRIVAEVERRLSVVDKLEAVVTTNLHRATRLRQSILTKAFVPCT